METSLHQEWRSRQRINGRAVAGTALFVGAILFVMSGGSPWSTAGTMNAVMGRDLPLGFGTLLVLHFLLAFIYTPIIAQVIYRFRLGAAIVTGAVTGLVLYLINYAIFHNWSVQMYSPEGRTFFVHMTFAIMASCTYKGMSVPKPFRGGPEEVSRLTHEEIPEAEKDDPEPTPVATTDNRPISAH